MEPNLSVQFFDEQFRRQLQSHDFSLNPFEQEALPYLSGNLLDFGCGLGNLTVAAARRGCIAVALDASPTAIEHIRDVAANEALPIQAEVADLRSYLVQDDYDSVACIGLLMFFDCPTAWRQLTRLKACVRPGGVVVVNVLIAGTTFMGMFAPEGHCLFEPQDFLGHFEGWSILATSTDTFGAPEGTQKVFLTVIARKPVDAKPAA